MKRLIFLIFILSSINQMDLLSQNESKLLRFPNTSRTEITFSYAGDIYIAPFSGGIARKLTTSEGLEIFPRFSPDGSQIAFLGEYDGNPEIYTMPSIGGEPKRITYSMDMPGITERQGPSKIIMQWSKDGNEILYRSRHESWNVLSGKLYTVSSNGGLPRQVPVSRGGFASLIADGTKMAFNRIFREFRTWKRYRGGQADDIWIYDFNTKELTNISNHSAQDIIPMWHGNKIYYLSDRDHTMNIFCYDLNTRQTKKITNFSEFDVKFPSLGAEHISFENGGELYTLKLDNDYLQRIEIILSDDKPYARSGIINVEKYIQSTEISPDGRYALVDARGDIFIVPQKDGNIRNLTQTSGFHERNSTWSPDGNWIAFIGDESGKDEVYIIKPDGSSKTQLTNDAQSYRWELKWSPDSKKLLNSDKEMRLFWIDIENKKTTEITKSRIWEIRDFNWSPDSRWIVYTDLVNNYMPIIYLHSIESKKTEAVTSEFFESSGAVFSECSKFLFFISKRSFNPTIGNFEYNFTYNNLSKVYGLTLRKDLPNPLIKHEVISVRFDADEGEESSDDKPTKPRASGKAKDPKDAGMLIDLNNISERIFELPVAAAEYWGLTSRKEFLYYVRNQPGSPHALFRFDFTKRTEEKVGDFSNYSLSKDGRSILFHSGKDYYIDRIKANLTPKDGKLDFKDLTIFVNRREEWQQIFNETWRQMKDFHYDPNMHGVDWLAMKNRYSSLLPHVAHRNDLTYILGEMIGEINVGHAYVGGGDMPSVDAVKVGKLGADFEFHKESGFYKITNILEGRNWEEKTRSPLTDPGIAIKAGDFILEIDGVRLNAETTPFKALLNKAGKFVNIKYNSTPSLNGAKEVMVKTNENESGLRYFNWVERNRRFVDSATNGRVGYVHIPDMSPTNGLNEFVKYFYPQVRKEALIIDDRFNGGGNVSPIIIERLRRILAIAKNARNQQEVFSSPNAVMTGPMVMLINEQSMSDGDLFPYQFKLMGLGPIIGKTTWGGVIGIRGSLPFIDGGYLNRPEFANFGRDGTWILEGVGMEPDIEWDNHPGKEFDGIDEQLIKAIEVIFEEMKKDTKPKLPQVPEFPIKK